MAARHSTLTTKARKIRGGDSLTKSSLSLSLYVYKCICAYIHTCTYIYIDAVWLSSGDVPRNAWLTMDSSQEPSKTFSVVYYIYDDRTFDLDSDGL